MSILNFFIFLKKKIFNLFIFNLKKSLIKKIKNKKIMDLTPVLPEEQIPIKSRIYANLKKHNKKFSAYEEIIKNYQKLMEKYNSTRSIAENTYYSRTLLIEDKGKIGNMNQSEILKNLRTLQNELEKSKTLNQEYLENSNKNLREIMNLKSEKEKFEKELYQLKPEYETLKSQSVIYKNKIKELEEENEHQKQLIQQMTLKYSDNEVTIKSLNDKLTLLTEENKSLNEKISLLKNDVIYKLNEFNDLIESAKQKKKVADIYFTEKINEYEKINEKKYYNQIEETNIPKKLKFNYKPHLKEITTLFFSNLGESFLSVGGDNIIKCYETSKNKESLSISNNTRITDACFDSKEELIFAGSIDKTLKLFNIKNNKLMHIFKGHNNEITCVKCLINQEKGLSGSKDHYIKEWDFKNLKLIKDHHSKIPCNCLSIMNKNNHFLSGHIDGTVKLWSNGKSFDKSYDIGDSISNIEILKNEKQFLIKNNQGEIKLFDIRNEKVIYSIDNTVLNELCKSNISISHDWKYFSVGSEKGNIFVFNLIDGNIIHTIENTIKNPITTIKWRPFHSQIYVGDNLGNLSIWVDN